MTFALDGITLAQAKANLDAWVACSQKIASKHQSHTMDVDGVEHTYTYVNAEHVDRMIQFWQGKVRAIQAAETAAASGRQRTGIRVTRGMPAW